MFYTGKGDDGSSGLFGATSRRHKSEPIFHAIGSVDELGALLGVCFAKAQQPSLNKPCDVPAIIRQIQEDLFVIQAELAGADKHLPIRAVERLEITIKEIEKHVDNPHSFVIAGSTELSAFLDLARATSRRVERTVLAVTELELSDSLKAYLNRLSSVLYVLARYTATKAGKSEQKPSY